MNTTDQQLRVVPDTTQPVEATDPPRGTVWQENAARFASQPEEYAAQEMRAACRDAVQLMVAGQPGPAYALLMRSFLRQARILGLAHVGIPGGHHLDQGGGL